MDNLLVTCPQTGCREEIGCLAARDGEILVVLRCTRFDPPEAMTCSATCTHCPTHRTVGSYDRWALPLCG